MVVFIGKNKQDDRMESRILVRENVFIVTNRSVCVYVCVCMCELATSIFTYLCMFCVHVCVSVSLSVFVCLI